MANQPPFSGSGNDLNLPINPADYVNDIEDNFDKCRDEILGLDSRLLAITGPLTTLNMSRRLINADDALVPGSDGLVIVDTTGGTVKLTLPLAATAPSDNKMRLFYIQHIAGTNRITIEPTVPDTFPGGQTKIVLPSVRGGLMYVGVWNDGAGDDQWIYGPALQNFLQLTHATPAAAATFLFPAFVLIPWDTVVDNLNDAVFSAAPASSVITSLIEQDVFVSHRISIDSTGAGAYSVTAGLLVNGSPVANTLITHDHPGNRDMNITSSVFKLHLNAGDTLELGVTQTGLTGNLIGAAMSVQSLV